MIDKIEKRLHELEFGLPERIRQVQLPHIPSISEITLVERDYYRFKGAKYTSSKRIFLAYNLPFKSAVNITPVFHKTLQKAVDENLIHPFILFINDKAVKWSKIEVVVDTKYTYLLIDTDETLYGNIFDGAFHNGFINLETGTIEEYNPIYPNSIYSDEITLIKGKEYKFITTNKDWRIRRWKLDGSYIDSFFIADEVFTYIPSEDQIVRVLFFTGETEENLAKFKVLSNTSPITTHKIIRIPYRIRYGEDNVINVNYKGNFYFDSNGLLTTDTSNTEMRVEIITPYLSCSTSDYSKGYIEVISDRYDKPATADNIIVFKNGILLDDQKNKFIDNGCNIFKYTDNTSGVIFKTFYYNKGNSSNDNIYKLDNEIIKNNIINNIPTQYMDKLKEKLNLDISYSDSINSLINSSVQNLKIIHISDNKFLVAFCDMNNRGKGTVFVVEYINGQIIAGPSYIFNNGATGSINLTKIDGIGRVLITFADTSNSNCGKCLIAIVSDIYLILGNVFEFSNSTIFNMATAKISNNKFVVAFSDLKSYGYGTAQLLTFYNDYLSLNISPKYIFASEDISNISALSIDENENVVICYSDSSGYGCMNVISIDNLGAKISSKYIFNNEPTNYINCVETIDGMVCLTYISNQKATTQLINIENKAVSIMPKYILSQNLASFINMSYIDKNHIVIVFNFDSDLIYGILEIYENTISYKHEGTIENVSISELITIGLYDKICITYTDSSQNNTAYMRVAHISYNELIMKIHKVMSYNPQLLESIYKELSPFESATYTGKEINSRIDSEGYLTMSRRRYNNIFCYVMIFLNGELYENYHTITYINDKFKLFIGDTLENEDILEFIFIKNVDNSISTLTVPSKDDIITLNSNFNEDNINLFSTEAEEVVKSGTEVEVKDTNENGTYSIKVAGYTEVIGTPNLQSPATIINPTNVRLVIDKGRRNLIINSSLEDNNISNFKGSNSSSIQLVETSPDGKDFPFIPARCIKNTVANGNSNGYTYQNLNLKTNTYYTLSAWVYIPSNSTGRLRLEAWYSKNEWSVLGFKEILEKDKWVRASYTFKTNNEVSSTVVGAGIQGGIPGDISYCALMKLEEGDSASPWTPAIEDNDSTATVINIPDEYALKSIDDIRDEITSDLKHIKRIEVVDNNKFTKSNVRQDTTGKRFKYSGKDKNIKRNGKVLCTHIPNINQISYHIQGTYLSTDESDILSLRFKEEDFSGDVTDASIIQWLNENNVYIQYEAKEPVVTDLTTILPESVVKNINNINESLYFYTISDNEAYPLVEVVKERPYKLDSGVIVNYNVPFSVINNGENRYNITLNNNFYYNKPLTVVSKKIFRYKKFVAEYNQVDIRLGDDFKYCIDKNKYMIFINGRAINKDNFELAVPGYYNPFDQVVLYINIILLPGDEIEVFYLPFETDDVYTKSSLSQIQATNVLESLLDYDLISDGDVSITNLKDDELTITGTPGTNRRIYFDVYLEAGEYTMGRNYEIFYGSDGLSNVTTMMRISYNDPFTIICSINKDHISRSFTISESKMYRLDFFISGINPSTKDISIRFYDIYIIKGKLNGDIQIDKSQIPFGLSKDNYWYFINGKKINPKDIVDINDTRINIRNNYKSIYNFTVMKFMSPIDIISKFVSYDDNWNMILTSMGDEIKKFFEATLITNEEIDIKVNETDMKATILEAFRHYYAKYNISSNPLVYDFNDILIDENDKDSEGRYIIHSSNANETNSVDVDR